MASKYAVTRLVARDISNRNFGARRDQLLGWIEDQSDQAIASDAVLGAMGYSKDVGRLLVEAGRIYAEAVANHESAIGGDGLDEATVLELIEGNAASGVRVWEAGELAYTNYLDNGLGSGPTAPFVVLGGVDVQLASAAPAGHPNFAHFAKFYYTDGGPPEMNFYPDRILSQLGGKAPVLMKVTAQLRPGGGGSQDFTIKQNGVTKAALTVADGVNTPTPWTTLSFPLTAYGPSDFINFHNARYCESWMTGLEIYVASEHPFMLNDLAIYDGQVWQSKMNNNPNQPGTDGSWQVVVGNVLTAKVPTYTTAGRPSASTAGLGAEIYDTTLKLPLFSNGTAWTDATGTVK